MTIVATATAATGSTVHLDHDAEAGLVTVTVTAAGADARSVTLPAVELAALARMVGLNTQAPSVDVALASNRPLRYLEAGERARPPLEAPATVEARNLQRGDVVALPGSGERVTVVRLFAVDEAGMLPVRYRSVGALVDVPGHAGKAHGGFLWATVTVAPDELLEHLGYDGKTVAGET